MAAEILAVWASPRRDGNSGILLERSLARFPSKSVEIVRTSDVKISPCEACGWCDTRGFCRIKDDFARVSSALDAARAVVVSSPIYFYGLPSSFKALIDRSQSLWARKHLLKKTSAPIRPAYTILVGGSGGKKLFDGALLTLKYFYDACNLAPSGSVLVRNADDAGSVRLDSSAMSSAASLMKDFRLSRKKGR